LSKIIPHNKPTIGKEEVQLVGKLLENNELTLGQTVKEFENEFEKYIGLPSAAVSSGTAAIHLALVIVGISKRDEVIVPSYTCPSVAMPILYLKATSVFADVDNNFNLSPIDVEKKLTSKTKAIILPHMFGYPAEIKEIKELCDAHGLSLIEDCAQAIGAKYNNELVGKFGDISVFSFNATKLITSIQGGMVSSNNPDLIKKLRNIRYPDSVQNYKDRNLKYSYRMSDINAVVGLSQLRKLNIFIKKRRKIASLYQQEIKEGILPTEKKGNFHVFFRYVVKSVKEPEKIISSMSNYGITCERIHFPPLHYMSIFKNNVRLVNTEKLSSSISLPIFPSLSEDEAITVSEKFNDSIEKYSN
jgi:perosamine synthetase